MARLDPKMMRQLGIATAAVSQWTASIVLSVLLGSWLDNRFGFAPAFLSISAFLGFVIGGYSAFQTFKQRHHDSQTR